MIKWNVTIDDAQDFSVPRSTTIKFRRIIIVRIFARVDTNKMSSSKRRREKKKRRKKKYVEVLSLICKNVQMYWHSTESALRIQIRIHKHRHTDTRNIRVSSFDFMFFASLLLLLYVFLLCSSLLRATLRLICVCTATLTHVLFTPLLWVNWIFIHMMLPCTSTALQLLHTCLVYKYYVQCNAVLHRWANNIDFNVLSHAKVNRIRLANKAHYCDALNAREHKWRETKPVWFICLSIKVFNQTNFMALVAIDSDRCDVR